MEALSTRHDFSGIFFFSHLNAPKEPPASPAHRHEIGAKLGERPIPTHVVRLGFGPNAGALLAAVRIQKLHGLSSDEVSEILSHARILAQSPHPSLACVTEPVISQEEVLILSEFIDGESMADLCHRGRAQGTKPPLAVWLRVLMDVLAGLQALHCARTREGQPAGMFHSEVNPSTIIVGIDGVARLIHTCRIPGLGFKVGGAHPYMAPELLLRESNVDSRADLYSVGALLWEAVSGEPLVSTDKTSAIIRKLLEGALPAARPTPDAAWATKIVPLIARALSIDRAARYQSADAMRLELTASTADHVASHAEVSRWICDLAGSRIVARRDRHGGLPLELPRHVPVQPRRPSPDIPTPSTPLASPFVPPGVAAPRVGRVSDPGERNVELAPILPPAGDLEGTESKPRKRRSWFLVAGVGAALIVTLGIFAVWSLRSDLETATSGTTGSAQGDPGREVTARSTAVEPSPATAQEAPAEPHTLNGPSDQASNKTETTAEQEPPLPPSKALDEDSQPSSPSPRTRPRSGKPTRHYDPLGI